MKLINIFTEFNWFAWIILVFAMYLFTRSIIETKTYRTLGVLYFSILMDILILLLPVFFIGKSMNWVHLIPFWLFMGTGSIISIFKSKKEYKRLKNQYYE